MKNCLIIISLFLALLTSCEKALPKKIEDPKFAKVWYDTCHGMPFSSKLKIGVNKKFEYYSRSCQGGTRSNGYWKIVNDTIILNSIKPKGCLFQYPFGVVCDIYNEPEIVGNTTIKNCDPDGRKAIYEIFENEKFFIRNDTLIHLEKWNVACPQYRIAFSSKEKVR